MIVKLRTLALTASTILMMETAAQAADLYAPAPMPAYTGGWYFGAFGGANWLDKTSFDADIGATAPLLLSVTNKYDTGFLVGGAFGYDFGQALGPLGLRLEGEVSYRDNDIKSQALGGALVNSPKGETKAFAGMANMLLDFDFGGPFSLYGGGGIGAANVEFDNHGTGTVTLMNDDDTNFAWQLIAGAGYEIAPGWTLDVQYRYFRVEDLSLTTTSGGGQLTSSTNYESHAILGGFRWAF